jgi:hypothetical protein
MKSTAPEALAYADKLLEEFRPGKKAASVESTGFLKVTITCTDGTKQSTSGYWAVEIMKRAKTP